jgi:hypothetical protein
VTPPHYLDGYTMISMQRSLSSPVRIHSAQRTLRRVACCSLHTDQHIHRDLPLTLRTFPHDASILTLRFGPCSRVTHDGSCFELTSSVPRRPCRCCAPSTLSLPISQPKANHRWQLCPGRTSTPQRGCCPEESPEAVFHHELLKETGRGTAIHPQVISLSSRIY